MSDELEKIIEKLDFENLNILQISDMLNDKFMLTSISNTMLKIKKKHQIFPPNVFGKCGIDPEANPCGDASEY